MRGWRGAGGGGGGGGEGAMMVQNKILEQYLISGKVSIRSGSNFTKIQTSKNFNQKFNMIFIF